MSHYENGIREPGLAFVTKVCDYYHVSADYMLGRTMDRNGVTIAADELYDSSQKRECATWTDHCDAAKKIDRQHHQYAL